MVALDPGAVPGARYTVRIAFLEEREIAEKLERQAASWGISVSAKVRIAVRSWLQDSSEHLTGLAPTQVVSSRCVRPKAREQQDSTH